MGGERLKDGVGKEGSPEWFGDGWGGYNRGNENIVFEIKT